jgi:hypothetical protein
MRVVNVQLREQAEATIKDTVATMSIDDVLSDKQPIIQELTTRLKGVTEGGEDDEGLGLRIVTVQIKEAVISSARLWSSLQRPFRAERAKTARLAELGHESEVTRTEAQEQKRAAMLNIDKEAEISLHTDQASAESFDRQEQERARRAVLEAKLLADSVAHERTKLATEAEIDRLKLENHLLLEKLKGDAAAVEARREIELSGLRQKVENDLSEARIKAQLIRALPKVAESMPKANEVKAITLGGSDTERLVASVKSLVDGFSSN